MFRRSRLLLTLLIVCQCLTPLAWAQLETAPTEETAEPRGYTINFNDVSIVEVIRYISKITNKNFIFDEQELDFNVTIVSEEQTSIRNLMAVLLQVLHIRDLTLLEQGNNIIIHQNRDIKRPARVITDTGEASLSEEDQLVTRVYRLDFADPKRVAEVLQPLISKQALVKVLEETRHIVVTDLATNVSKVTDLVSSLDQPNTALDIGQYVAQNLTLDSLVTLAEKILRPIAGDTPLVMTPQQSSNSIFVISTPYFVQRSMSVLETLDVPFGRTRILSFDDKEGRGPGSTVGRRTGDRRDFEEGVDEEMQDFFQDVRDEAEENFVIDDQGRRVRREPRGGERFSRFRDARDFKTPDLFFDFGDGRGEAEFEFPEAFEDDLPIGHIDTTHFYIHKLEYRKGDQIQDSLQNVASSLAQSGTVNVDLLSSIASAQWIETSNSIIFTGTKTSLDKVKELIRELDAPLRQVLIEVLVIETTLDNSLNFGVELGTNTSQPEFGGNFGFYETGSALASSLGQISAAAAVDASGLTSVGLTLGAIGKSITHNGVGFESLGVLVKALHKESDTNVVMNPKIITEDNSPAELFVGTNERYNSQSIAAEGSGNVTSNFEFRDVGSTLRVTPLIGSNDIVTLEISQELSTDAQSDAASSGGTSTSDADLGPVTRIARTDTRVHVPDRHFLILSGHITETNTYDDNRIPCLGSLPLIGSLMGSTTKTTAKRNLMLFIRPTILDTVAEMREVTRQQQDLFRDKSRKVGRSRCEFDCSLDFLNLR